MPASRTRSCSAPGALAAEQHVAGPLDLPGLPLGEADRRPVRLEVEELLGIDLGDQLGVERFRRRGQRGGRGAGRVVPAGECTDQDRRAELAEARPPRPARPSFETSATRSGPRRASSGPAQERLEACPPRPRRNRGAHPRRSLDRRASTGAALPGRLRLRAQGPADRPQRLLYLSLELRDRSGSIPARAFREADRLAARFERGDAIRVSGKVERFRGELVAEIDDIRAARCGRARPGRVPAVRLPRPGGARGLPRAPDPRGPRPDAARRSSSACSSRTRSRPSSGGRPARRAGHHAYLGGLIEHTVAVGDAGRRGLPAPSRGSTPTC